MSIFKCKMCGGDLEIIDGQTVCECEYCGTKQTVPALDDEKKAQLFKRANRLRFNCEFDKASGIYENIISEFPEEPEAYWGMILCKYGIEYVDDPATAKKIPTCHRSSFDSVFDDESFDMVMEYSDTLSKSVYREEAKAIEEIRKGIVEISSKEEPYDIFICYKETDENGQRTIDSVIAQDVYDVLTEKGYKVFFSRITLEDKLGVEYEPYIFAALNSAKVMLAFGTKYEYYDAVWVKNEWSRFLRIIANDHSRYLIPCFRDIDAYDMPKEFAKLQSQDMGKVGAIQDLVRGIEKIIHPGKAEKETVVIKETQASSSVAPLLERAFMFLEDGKWQDADIYCEKVLDIDPKNAEAYLGKLMAELKVSQKDDLDKLDNTFDNLDNFYKASRFSDELSRELLKDNKTIRLRNETAQKQKIYDDAAEKMNKALSEDDYKSVASKFGTISSFKDADEQKKLCLEKSETAHNDSIYNSAVSHMNTGFSNAEKNLNLEKALREFESVIDWKDSRTKIDECNQKIEEIKIAEEEARIVDEKAKAKKKKTAMIVIPIVAVVIVFLIVLNTVIIPKNKLKKAMDELDAGNYDSAYSMLEELGESDTINSSKYDRAVELINEGDAKSAYILLLQIPDYKDVEAKTEELLKSEPNLAFLNASVGDTVIFGSYEQDNNTSNGKEEIEWRVLEVKDGKALIISNKVLDCQQYNPENDDDITWETCSLRAWLNDDFMNTAFDKNEQSIIADTEVISDGKGNDITDKVFILSETEAEEYFSSDDERVCEATAYARSSGVYTNDGGAYWWLRTRYYIYYASYVYISGDVSYSYHLYSANIGVRPALWIEI